MSKKTVSKIDKSEVIEVNKINTPVCSMFESFKLNNPACKDCEKKFNARFKACKSASAKKAESKKNVKVLTSKMDCFNARIDSDTHRFIMDIYKTPQTMKAIKNNPKFHNTFYCKANSLIKNGYMLKNKKSGTYAMSSKGRKKLEKWIELNKAEKKELKAA